MKSKFLIFIITIKAFVLYGQGDRMSKFIVDTKETYTIKNENKIYNTLFDDPDANEITRAYLIVNNDTLRDIKSTKAHLEGNALRILIYQTDPAYSHKYEILIKKDLFCINYNFITSGPEEKREIHPMRTFLKLSTSKLKTGQEIRGYTEFEGKCVGECWESTIAIKGNFKVVIE